MKVMMVAFMMESEVMRVSVWYTQHDVAAVLDVRCGVIVVVVVVVAVGIDDDAKDGDVAGGDGGATAAATGIPTAASVVYALARRRCRLVRSWWWPCPRPL